MRIHITLNEIACNGNVLVLGKLKSNNLQMLLSIISFHFLFYKSSTHTWRSSSYFELNKNTLKALCNKFSDSIFSIKWPVDEKMIRQLNKI